MVFLYQGGALPRKLRVKVRTLNGLVNSVGDVGLVSDKLVSPKVACDSQCDQVGSRCAVELEVFRR